MLLLYTVSDLKLKLKKNGVLSTHVDLDLIECNCYSHNGGAFGRDYAECNKKWQDYKHRTLKKYDRIRNPPTGGGAAEMLCDLEDALVEFFVDRKSGVIRGVIGGIESAVRRNCMTFTCVQRKTSVN